MAADLISPDEARARLLRSAKALPPRDMALAEALSRPLAKPILARRSNPPAALSAMDGYACRSVDLGAAPLALVGESAAGRPYDAAVSAGQCVRIFTGALVPAGADQVILQEDVTAEGSRITTSNQAQPGAHIRKAGGDFSVGSVLIERGARLSERHLALAAAGGHARVSVTPKPDLAIISTGDEIVPPDQAAFSPSQMPDSVTPMLTALLMPYVGSITARHVGDRRQELDQALAAACGSADVVLTVGGASVGDHDLIKPALDAIGVGLDFWKIAMRPGKPLMAGRKGETLFMGLPGNPVSAYVAARLFTLPFLQVLAGDPALPPSTRTARLRTALPAGSSRTHYMRARLSQSPPGALPWIEPADSQDSSRLGILASSDGLLIHPAYAPARQSGDEVEFLPL